MDRVARSILFGQASLTVFLVVCVLLNPHFLLEKNEGGVSNYGLYAKTIVPYTLAFGGAGIYTLQAALVTRKSSIRTAFFVLGSLYLFVLLSTFGYNQSHTMDTLHHLTSIGLLVAEIVIASWFSFRSHSKAAWGALLVEYLGFLAGILNLFYHVNILFVAEALMSLGFSGVLIATSSAIAPVIKHKMA